MKIRLGTVILGASALALGAAVAIGMGGHGASPSAEVSASAGSLEELESLARANPGDAARWQALGAARFEEANYEKAVEAYDKATAAAPDRAALWSALGEARVMASRSDPMPAEAAADFRKAIGLDPKDPRARYFLGVQKDLGGDHKGAVEDWLALLADTPPGAAWEADLRRTIEQVGKINKIEVASRMGAVKQPAPPAAPALTAGMGIPGPSAQDLSDASRIPPSQQRAMAEGMVARLEGKLQADPSNVEGWVMLMRSRATLGQPDKASAALKAAIAANPGAAGRLRKEAEVLGVK